MSLSLLNGKEVIMSERDYMVIGLVKEVLGPREGPLEHLPPERDPRNEYITGVLAPEQRERDVDDLYADVDEVAEEVGDDEDQGGEGVIIAPPSAFSPALDPKSQPRSIGLSFVILAPSGTPHIDICATWARYVQHQQGGWQREPKVYTASSLPVDKDGLWNVGPDVDLYLRTRRQDNGSYRVSLYLVNQRSIVEGQKPATPDFVFQPQIRIHCTSGKLLSVDIAPPQALHDPLSIEDMELAMLYRNRAALARGHLCGAMWKDIDPERPHATLRSPQEAPFAWTDRDLVTAKEQAKYSPADVRTEFVPCYPVEAPEVQWVWPTGTRPELNPLVLAQTWKPAAIHQCLDSLVEGYEQWIAVQYQQIVALPSYWQSFARTNLNTCEQVARRMREGIDKLISDVQVRLAFCFANQAIALQSQWTNGAARSWRPFQLAFLLLNISALADPMHPDRSICDLLWFPTGGGKTEAYLGLAAFTLGLRRLRARKLTSGDRTGAGVTVLSRYTLRLLTIQQFRRALGVITACEVLRVANLSDPSQETGWRPKDFPYKRDFLWGGVRFSVGMWVGGGVTPNNLLAIEYMQPSKKLRHIAGALEILQGLSSRGYEGPDPALRKISRSTEVDAEGDPAQVLTCPACRAWLAIPQKGLPPKQYTMHFVFTGVVKPLQPGSVRDMPPRIIVNSARLVTHTAPNTHTLSVTFTVVGENATANDIDLWWHDFIKSALPGTTNPRLLAARPSRPGYFFCSYTNIQSTSVSNNFEIYCPNPDCALNNASWAEQVPISLTATKTSTSTSQTSLFDTTSNELPSVEGAGIWQDVPAFTQGRATNIAERIPIPACTVDDQVYHRCPSLVVATVDKFARLAFEPKAGALFGNVSHYHARWGYYRRYAPPRSTASLKENLQEHPPGLTQKQTLRVEVPAFQPPELIIQDELHLLEGPLGSMVGLYETAIDTLCERFIEGVSVRPKYVASTATVRQAETQVQALFARSVTQFPPSALNADDRFFAVTKETHPLESVRAGRLYAAVAGPGKGAQTPIVRLWAALLQTAFERKQAGAGNDLDGFWTLVGYFNALRELAGSAALYRQDIVERMKLWASPRLLEDALELSSRANSLDLPGLLEQLGVSWGEDAVLATSMFGTGVDVDRLGLMVVHGQPKTTSAYIQATGRVGRQQGGLVVTFFRVSRPRDLDHYEFFTGYHRKLYRAVEPITVTPFAPRARDRGFGPLAVVLLRQSQQLLGNVLQQLWYVEQRINKAYISRAYLMATHRRDAEVMVLPGIFEQRAMQQPRGRRPPSGVVINEMDAELDRWQAIANDVIRAGGGETDRMVYAESSMTKEPERSVVLGDAQHQLIQLPVAFENAPQSLRDVEATTQFKES